MTLFTQILQNVLKPLAIASAAQELQKIQNDVNHKLNPEEEVIANAAEQALINSALGHFNITVDPAPSGTLPVPTANTTI